MSKLIYLPMPHTVSLTSLDFFNIAFAVITACYPRQNRLLVEELAGADLLAVPVPFPMEELPVGGEKVHTAAKFSRTFQAEFMCQDKAVPASGMIREVNISNSPVF